MIKKNIVKSIKNVIKDIRKDYISNSTPIIKKHGKQVFLNKKNITLSSDFISSGFEEN